MSPTSLSVLLSPDLFIFISTFLSDVRDLVKCWMVSKQIYAAYPSSSQVWTEVLRFLLLRTGTNTDDVILRLGCRQDCPSLRIIERMSVKRKCSRSGCGLQYRECENTEDACRYHSGKMRMGYLSCCKEKSFRAEGCRVAFHDGALYEYLFQDREDDADGGGRIKSSGLTEIEMEIEMTLSVLAMYDKDFGGVKIPSATGYSTGKGRDGERGSGAIRALHSLKDS